MGGSEGVESRDLKEVKALLEGAMHEYAAG
jgi:hypothetical protein